MLRVLRAPTILYHFQYYHVVYISVSQCGVRVWYPGPQPPPANQNLSAFGSPAFLISLYVTQMHENLRSTGFPGGPLSNFK